MAFDSHIRRLVKPQTYLEKVVTMPKRNLCLRALGTVWLSIVTLGFGLTAAIMTADPINASEWVKQRQIASTIKRAERRDEFASSMECRVDADARTYRIEARFNWRENTDNTEWRAMYFTGGLDWQPGAPGEQNQWRAAYKKVLVAPISGKRHTCALYFKR